jgi:hypothetical protein
LAVEEICDSSNELVAGAIGRRQRGDGATRCRVGGSLTSGVGEKVRNDQEEVLYRHRVSAPDLPVAAGRERSGRNRSKTPVLSLIVASRRLVLALAFRAGISLGMRHRCQWHLASRTKLPPLPKAWLSGQTDQKSPQRRLSSDTVACFWSALPRGESSWGGSKRVGNDAVITCKKNMQDACMVCHELLQNARRDRPSFAKCESSLEKCNASVCFNLA